MKRTVVEDALTPMHRLTLEAALQYVGEDELVEITPENVSLRKKVLRFNMR